jgi:dimethylglycine dehydrogenase
MSSMGLEKSYRLIPREMSVEYNALESGLDRFVHPSKGEFIGRDAVVAAQEKGLRWNFVTLEVHGVDDADARGSEAIHKDGKLVGRATNGGFAWRLNKSIALAMVKPEYSAVGTELEISILGKDYKVTIIPESPFDPENERLRG